LNLPKIETTDVRARPRSMLVLYSSPCYQKFIPQEQVLILSNASFFATQVLLPLAPTKLSLIHVCLYAL